MVAYLVTILLYRHNGDARDDGTVRRYMRRVEVEEESWAAVDERTSMWLGKKGCVMCHREAIAEVIREMMIFYA